MTDTTKIIATLVSNPRLAERHASVLAELIEKKPPETRPERKRGMGLSRGTRVARDDQPTNSESGDTSPDDRIENVISFLRDFEIIDIPNELDDLVLDHYRMNVSKKIKSIFNLEFDTILLMEYLKNQINNNKVAQLTAPSPMPTGQTPTEPETQSDNTALGTSNKLVPELRADFSRALTPNDMAEILARYIDMHSISIRQVARNADVNHAVISKILKGNASVEQSLKILEKLGFTSQHSIEFPQAEPS